MICAPCGEAGDLWASYRKEEDGAVRKFVERRVVELHEKCPGYTSCDCLHRLGPPSVKRV